MELLHGDCLELMKSIPDKSIDAIITDPPYGTTACKWDSVIPFEPMWEQLNRIIKPNGAIVLFGNEPFSSYLRISNIKNYRYDCYWKKSRFPNFLFVKKQFGKIIENISIFYKNQPTYNPQMENGNPYEKKGDFSINKRELITTNFKNIGKLNQDGLRYPKNLLSFNLHNVGNYHPTQKPVALMEYLIKTYTNEGETVLDFTMGSGTTGIACVNTNRNFIGIEKDDKYFEISKKRIKEVINNKKKQISLF